eukprot:CAMPEP_0178985122 /NCGR_PEP_ID=MMETSP0795-20121207/1981_1 /TAXON_ID=88552 /ORGANISM="Amoebophrya sp., Strain Ameob2" /LENGTH=1428 /DNA_ID=CAMNT_0020676053 /DNA_START=510 /DNA_END=4796 /DNA_ORIENTATION=-
MFSEAQSESEPPNDTRAGGRPSGAGEGQGSVLGEHSSSGDESDDSEVLWKQLRRVPGRAAHGDCAICTTALNDEDEDLHAAVCPPVPSTTTAGEAARPSSSSAAPGEASCPEVDLSVSPRRSGRVLAFRGYHSNFCDWFMPVHDRAWFPAASWMRDLDSDNASSSDHLYCPTVIEERAGRFASSCPLREKEVASRPYTVVQLPCNHFFHSECLESWFFAPNNYTRSCPVCRHALKPNARAPRPTVGAPAPGAPVNGEPHAFLRAARDFFESFAQATRAANSSLQQVLESHRRQQAEREAERRAAEENETASDSGLVVTSGRTRINRSPTSRTRTSSGTTGAGVDVPAAAAAAPFGAAAPRSSQVAGDEGTRRVSVAPAQAVHGPQGPPRTSADGHIQIMPFLSSSGSSSSNSASASEEEQGQAAAAQLNGNAEERTQSARLSPTQRNAARRRNSRNRGEGTTTTHSIRMMPLSQETTGGRTAFYFELIEETTEEDGDRSSNASPGRRSTTTAWNSATTLDSAPAAPDASNANASSDDENDAALRQFLGLGESENLFNESASSSSRAGVSTSTSSSASSSSGYYPLAEGENEEGATSSSSFDNFSDALYKSLISESEGHAALSVEQQAGDRNAEKKSTVVSQKERPRVSPEDKEAAVEGDEQDPCPSCRSPAPLQKNSDVEVARAQDQSQGLSDAGMPSLLEQSVAGASYSPEGEARKQERLELIQGGEQKLSSSARKEQLQPSQLPRNHLASTTPASLELLGSMGSLDGAPVTTGTASSSSSRGARQPSRAAPVFDAEEAKRQALAKQRAQNEADLQARKNRGLGRIGKRAKALQAEIAATLEFAGAVEEDAAAAPPVSSASPTSNSTDCGSGGSTRASSDESELLPATPLPPGTEAESGERKTEINAAAGGRGGGGPPPPGGSASSSTPALARPSPVLPLHSPSSPDHVLPKAEAISSTYHCSRTDVLYEAADFRPDAVCMSSADDESCFASCHATKGLLRIGTRPHGRALPPPQPVWDEAHMLGSGKVDVQGVTRITIKRSSHHPSKRGARKSNFAEEVSFLVLCHTNQDRLVLVAEHDHNSVYALTDIRKPAGLCWSEKRRKLYVTAAHAVFEYDFYFDDSGLGASEDVAPELAKARKVFDSTTSLNGERSLSKSTPGGAVLFYAEAENKHLPSAASSTSGRPLPSFASCQTTTEGREEGVRAQHLLGGAAAATPVPTRVEYLGPSTLRGINGTGTRALSPFPPGVLRATRSLLLGSGKRGSTLRSLAFPSQIALDDAPGRNALYVADTFNDRVLRLDLCTNKATIALGKGFVHNIHLRGPRGVCVSQDSKSLYVADTGGQRILSTRIGRTSATATPSASQSHQDSPERSSSSSSSTSSFEIEGITPWVRPCSLAVGSGYDGFLYVSDKNRLSRVLLPMPAETVV